MSTVPSITLKAFLSLVILVLLTMAPSRQSMAAETELRILNSNDNVGELEPCG